MKLVRAKFITIFLVCSLFLSVLILNPKTILPVRSADRDIVVDVDYRVELLTIMQLLGGYNYSKKPLDFAYKQEVLKYFNPYKGQDSIRKLTEFFNHTKSRDTSIGCVVFFSQPPELKQLVPFTPQILDMSGGEQSLKMFAEALRSFAKATNFVKFMEKQKDTFQTMKEQTKLEGKTVTYLKQLEGYYGYQQHSYHIVLAPFIQCGGFGPSIEYEDGSLDVYSMIGPCDVIADVPNFLYGEDFEEIIFHEFSHSFVNPLTIKYGKEVGECSKLISPITKEMERMRYGNQWYTCLNEHLIRTFTTRIAAINKGDEEAKRVEQEEIRNGFVYLPLLLEKYKMYEKNRATYKTYKDFYAVLIKYLVELSTYPSIPTYFETYLTDDDEIGLKWKDNAMDEKGYRIYRTEDLENPFELLAEIPNNSVFFADDKTEAGKTYFYKVSAFNDKGEMETPVLSIEAPLVEPKIVKNFKLEYAKGQTVNFTWDYDTLCMGFILYEMPEKVEIERLGKADRTIKLTNVSFEDHQYQLFAYNESMGKRKLSREKEILSVTVLQAPQKLLGKVLGIDSIELTWTLSSDKIDKISVLRRIGNQEFVTIKELGKDTSFVDGKLETNTEYEYKLIASKGELITSDESETIKVKTDKIKEPEPPKIETITLKFQIGNKKFWVNTEQRDMDVAPINLEGRMFLPIRYVTTSIGAEIAWDAKELKTTIKLGQTIIELWIGKNVAKINGTDKPIDATNPKIKPINLSGRTFLPLRFVGESLGCELKWDAKAQEATLIYKKVG